MSPELEKYLQMDKRLGSEIARLTLDLEAEERRRRQAAGYQKAEFSWPEFIATLVVAVLLLNSLAVHMGHQLGWWDVNVLVGAIDQRLTALNAYQSEVAPLLYGARALGWLGQTLLYIFFALPYQLLTVVAELLAMVLPAASPFLPYAEGVILAVAALNVLKGCPLVQGFRNSLGGVGNAEVASSKKRIREIRQQIKAKESERSKLPRDKVMAAQQAEMEERREREAEKRRRREEAERWQREQEAQRKRSEEEAERRRKEEVRQRGEEAARKAVEASRLRQRIRSLYWNDSNLPSSTGSDILILSGDTIHATILAETLRDFCPDDRKIFVLSQIREVEERLRSGAELSVYLLASDILSEEQLYRFFMSDVGMRRVMLLRVEDYDWVNEEGGESPRPVNCYDQERRSSNYSLTVKRLDVWGLEMLYVAAELVSHTLKEGESFPFRKEFSRRFARYVAAAQRNRGGWHLEGDTLVIDDTVQSIDGRAPWADVRNSIAHVTLRYATAFASYDAEHRTFCSDWRLEGLFEGCSNLISVDLSQMSSRFNYYEEMTNSFVDCPKLREVRVPEYWRLVDGLQAQGFQLDGDGVWRRPASMGA